MPKSWIFCNTFSYIVAVQPSRFAFQLHAIVAMPSTLGFCCDLVQYRVRVGRCIDQALKLHCVAFWSDFGGIIDCPIPLEMLNSGKHADQGFDVLLYLETALVLAYGQMETRDS